MILPRSDVFQVAALDETHYRPRMSLTQKSLSAVVWSGADVFMRQGLQFFVSILLARLLLPEDFGVIAMLYVFISLAGLFIDSGFSSALIQRQDITLTDESTVFFFNLGMGALMALVLCAAAPWIAVFFELPILLNLTYVMALNLFISAFGSIHNTLLTKALDFKTIMKVGLGATSCSGLLAVLMAWWGFGVWSLAWQTLLSSLVTVVLLWWWHPWRPHWEFSVSSLRRLFRFGSFLMLSSLLEVLYTRLYAVLIGKLFSARELGYYTRADTTQHLPSNVLKSVLNRVAFPVFSMAAADKTKLVRGLRKVLMAMMLINIPAMLGMMALAEPLVLTLFGSKWLPSVPFLQVLCLAGALWPLHLVNLNVLKAQGRSDLFFRIEIIKKVVGVSLTLLASLHGVMAIAWSQVFIGLFAFFINAHYSGVLLGYGPWSQLRELMPFSLVGMAVGAMIWIIRQQLHWPPAVELFVLTGLGAVVYFFICRLLRLTAFDEMIAMIIRLKILR